MHGLVHRQKAKPYKSVHILLHVYCVDHSRQRSRWSSEGRLSSPDQNKAKGNKRRCFTWKRTAGHERTEGDSDRLWCVCVRFKCCRSDGVSAFMTEMFLSVCLMLIRLWVNRVHFLIHAPAWASEGLCSSQLMGNHYGCWQMPSSWLPRQLQWFHPSCHGWCLRNGLLSQNSLSLMASLIGAMHKWIRTGQNSDLGGTQSTFSPHTSSFLITMES